MAGSVVVVQEPMVSVVEIAAEETVVVEQEIKTTVIEVGVVGPQGPPGVSAASYLFTQAVPSAVWTINHGLGFYPAVTVIDSADTAVEGDVEYPDDNTVILTFAAAFSGRASLS